MIYIIRSLQNAIQLIRQYEEEYSKLPSVEKLSIQFSNLDELNKISIQLKHIELSSSEKERLDSLEEKLSNVTDKEIDYYMKAYNKNVFTISGY